MFRNKVYVLVFSVILFFNSSGQVFADEIPNLPLTNARIEISQLSPDQVEQVSNELSVTPEEIVSLEENLAVAFDSLDTSLKNDEVRVSENLILEVTTEQVPSLQQNMLRSTIYTRTIRTTLSLKNIVGGTVVTLSSYGVFDTNGSTSKPLDAYGTYSGFLWSLDYISSYKSSTIYNAYVRNTYKGSLNIGAGDISVTIQSFNKTGVVYCNAVGTNSGYWY